MPQVIEFPPLAGDVRAALNEVVRVCKESRDGEPFRELRTRLRAARLWDSARPATMLRLLGLGGRTVARSPLVVAVAAAADDAAAHDLLTDRLFELNPVLAKTIVDLVASRAHGKDELYKHLGTLVFRGRVPSRPDLDSWVALALALGVFRQVGIALSPGPRFERWRKQASLVEIDELLAEDRPWPEPEIPPVDDDGAAPVAASAGGDTAAVVAAAGGAAPPGGLPAALRHLGGVTLPPARGRQRPVPAPRFAGGFSDELLADTGAQIAAWWAEAGVARDDSRELGCAALGIDGEAWVERADEVVYRLAVAAALAFRLDADRDAVVRAFKALEAAGVLADLYHGTVPAELPAAVDARALMLASLAARRCAEAPELAATLEQQPSAGAAFAVLDAALGRGLFRLELFWILRQLGTLGVVRWDDLPEVTALPHRAVRDTLFRLGFLATPYAADAASLAAAAKAARRAVGGAEPADEVLVAFSLAAGCGYDCAHRKTCEYACRERLE